MLRKFLIAALTAAGIAAVTPALAAGGDTKMVHREWSFDGVFGRFDNAQLQRGLQVYREVCSTCHGLELVRFRNLLDIGVSEDDAKAYAEGYEITDTVDDDGNPVARPLGLADRLPSPFPNEKAARAANNGALPPDLSLMAKARMSGPDYIYTMLTAYTDEPPADFVLMDGMYYNPAFPGHQIAMPQMLFDGGVEFESGAPNDLPSVAADTAAFLMWAAEPALEVRKSMGVKVMLFLIVLTALFYAYKRQIWSRVKH
ncbi:MAG: cytochrome c1 [Rhodospirillaceae bacterium]